MIPGSMHHDVNKRKPSLGEGDWLDIWFDSLDAKSNEEDVRDATYSDSGWG
jgi:hypothetical protein